MALTPVARRSVPDAVFDQLATDILGGELAPGSELPAERRLAEVLGVSRPAVREALQRLAQAGLIDVRQGDSTTVRDFRRSAGPELLPRLLVRDGAPDLGVVRAILETRFTLAPDVARRCAIRRDAAVLGRLEELVGQLEDATTGERQLTVHTLWSTIVDGGGNVVERLLFNALEAAYLPAIDVLASVMSAEIDDVDGYRALVEAIADRDAARAGALARRITGAGTQAALTALDELAIDAGD
ncbi:MAG: GntR family transcriptional regulator [Nitriliruptor sp.]|uniref:FadR/GntR family transcriptional regulator n=1 Tax=Nitriliruptor sp. TaxID=2448056 RepID=UPI00349FDC72